MVILCIDGIMYIVLLVTLVQVYIYGFNPSTATLATLSLENDEEHAKFEILKPFFFFHQGVKFSQY